MGNTSSQPAAPDADVFAAPTPRKPGHEDDIAASSQLATEAQTPQSDTQKKKDKKGKKEKRRSRDLQNAADENTADPVTDGAENAPVSPVPVPDAPQNKDSQKKKKKRRSAPDEAAQEPSTSAPEPAPAETVTDARDADAGATQDGPNKKRKRKSKDAAAVSANPDAQSKSEAVAPTPVPVLEAQNADERSNKKQRKSKRDVPENAPAKISSTPIPLPILTAVPVQNVPKSAQVQDNASTQAAETQQPQASKKSKKKSDTPEANKAVSAGDKVTPVQLPEPAQTTAENADVAQTEESSEKKNKKKKKKSRHDEVATEDPVQNAATPEAAAEPAEAAPQSRVEVPEADANEEANSSKKQKKKKRSRNPTPAQNEVSVGTEMSVPDNSALIDPALENHGVVNGNAQPTEVPHDGSHAKQKKRKRTGDAEPRTETVTGPSPSEATPPNHPEAASQPKPKKRKQKTDSVSADAGKAVESTKDTSGDNPVTNTGDFPEQGPFTAKELARLDGSVESYREYHNLTQERVNELIQGVSGMDESVRPMWDEITGSLPNRKRQSIYRLCRRRYHNFDKRGSWTQEEDEELRQAHNAAPGRWKEIGQRIGRMPDDARDRWRNYLKCGEAKVTEKWDDNEINKLLNAVHECCDLLLKQLPEEHERYWRKELSCEVVGKPFWTNPDIRDFVHTLPDFLTALRDVVEHRAPSNSGKTRRAADAPPFDEGGNVIIDWNLVSEKMGQRRSRLQCLMKFRGLERHFSDSRKPRRPDSDSWRLKNGYLMYQRMLPGDKYNIVKTLATMGAADEERIYWARVQSNDPDTDWKPHVRKAALQEMKKLVPPQETLPELLSSLMRYLETNHPNELRDFYVMPPKEPKPKPEPRYKLSAARISEEDDEQDEDGDLRMGMQGASAQGNMDDDVDSVLGHRDDEDEAENQGRGYPAFMAGAHSVAHDGGR
ncbi:uncharacterized protein K452DRAFT_293878 [Aplosporella prunicola CBS 121167]|uniref:Uncharacterized protein n=1 Tax=Aplosporella prunicola CBS 121167 TaxID=1176127 RepID=A0A6A6BVZ8_9PEZI|nr:uncharacterized protein K452DRAFT_293878 [Aplosporella prunicola CBS 121167]KAF2147465.1 hypothetical protein K452DRAFT_293878 [Aplosporella prunicola CBS 121167]